MSLSPLINPVGASNSGGVAGRLGFSFQDHIAARYLLQMLRTPELEQVECETGDDIALRWNDGTSRVLEYVQVKITDSEWKWSMGEIWSRTPKSAKGTSIIEKSLNCDAFPGVAKFRFISRRDVRKDLEALKIPRSERLNATAAQELTTLGTRLSSKLPGVKSPRGTSIETWTNDLLWEYVGEFDAVKQHNVNALLRLAEGRGECIYVTAAEAIYDDLLKLAVDAGNASRKTDPAAKVITRQAILDWWDRKAAEIRSQNNSVFKVYQFATIGFFSELHRVDEAAASRSMASYDAEFDGGVWRGPELADYLIRWLPEVALPARVLAKHTTLEARELIKSAVASFGRSGLNYDQLLAHLLLHAILRHYHDSEPIACRLFSVSMTDSSFVDAHIIPSPTGDELWLGQAHVTSTKSWSDILAAASADLEALFERDFLKKERELILQMREPRHMRSTTLEKALARHGKIDDLVKVLNLPILIAYDSSVLASGFKDDYVARLRDEAVKRYENLKGSLSSKLTNVRIHVFLIPVQGAVDFSSVFKKTLDACHGN